MAKIAAWCGQWQSADAGKDMTQARHGVAKKHNKTKTKWSGVGKLKIS